MSYNVYERDLAVVNIFFGDSTVFGNLFLLLFPLKSINPEFERSPKMTWMDFISGFGGFCGLCLGFSFVSFVEIIYWFSLKLCSNF